MNRLFVFGLLGNHTKHRGIEVLEGINGALVCPLENHEKIVAIPWFIEAVRGFLRWFEVEGIHGAQGNPYGYGAMRFLEVRPPRSLGAHKPQMVGQHKSQPQNPSLNVIHIWLCPFLH